jgi:PAS domain S-box-containing protein
MIRFENLSIKNKLIVLIVLTSVLVSVIALSFFSYLDVRSFKDELEQQGEINAHLIGNYCITPLTFGYADDARKILEELNTIPSIHNAFVYTEDNKLFAQYHKSPELAMDLPAIENKKSFYRNNYLHVFHEITFQGIKYGTVYFRISTSKIDEKITSMLYILIFLAVIVTIFSFIIAQKLQGIISKPLLHLSQLTKRVSEKDDYSIRIKQTGKDEIAHLQKGFNKMLEKLETRKDERDKAEQALRDSEEKYRQIVETAQEGIWIIDKKANTAFTNSRLVEMFGYSREEMLGKEFFTFMDDRYHMDAKKMLTNGKTLIPATNEFCFSKKNGDDIWVLMSTNPLYDDHKNYNGTLAMVADITDRKNNLKELEKYKNNLEKLVKQRTKKLREAQKELIRNEKMATLGKLTATVSHELRNPLGTIRSSFYTVQTRTKDKNLNIDRSLERIDRNISRCDNIIEDLLDYSRTKDLLFVEADIDSWFIEFFRDYQIPQNIELQTKLRSNAKTRIDLERFRRCIINLIDNACQAINGLDGEISHKNGIIKIITYVEKEHLLIDISDSGPGIAKENIDKIFEPLFSTKSFGFGLGLSVVRQVMDLHKGKISVKSQTDKGTTFSLKLPVSHYD